jgi:hypothetical protein
MEFGSSLAKNYLSSVDIFTAKNFNTQSLGYRITTQSSRATSLTMCHRFVTYSQFPKEKLEIEK